MSEESSSHRESDIPNAVAFHDSSMSVSSELTPPCASTGKKNKRSRVAVTTTTTINGDGTKLKEIVYSDGTKETVTTCALTEANESKEEEIMVPSTSSFGQVSTEIDRKKNKNKDPVAVASNSSKGGSVDTSKGKKQKDSRTVLGKVTNIFADGTRKEEIEYVYPDGTRVTEVFVSSNLPEKSSNEDVESSISPPSHGVEEGTAASQQAKRKGTKKQLKSSSDKNSKKERKTKKAVDGAALTTTTNIKADGTPVKEVIYVDGRKEIISNASASEKPGADGGEIESTPEFPRTLDSFQKRREMWSDSTGEFATRVELETVIAECQLSVAALSNSDTPHELEQALELQVYLETLITLRKGFPDAWELQESVDTLRFLMGELPTTSDGLKQKLKLSRERVCWMERLDKEREAQPEASGDHDSVSEKSNKEEEGTEDSPESSAPYGVGGILAASETGESRQRKVDRDSTYSNSNSTVIVKKEPTDRVAVKTVTTIKGNGSRVKVMEYADGSKETIGTSSFSEKSDEAEEKIVVSPWLSSSFGAGVVLAGPNVVKSRQRMADRDSESRSGSHNIKEKKPTDRVALKTVTTIKGDGTREKVVEYADGSKESITTSDSAGDRVALSTITRINANGTGVKETKYAEGSKEVVSTSRVSEKSIKEEEETEVSPESSSSYGAEAVVAASKTTKTRQKKTTVTTIKADGTRVQVTKYSTLPENAKSDDEENKVDVAASDLHTRPPTLSSRLSHRRPVHEEEIAVPPLLSDPIGGNGYVAYNRNDDLRATVDEEEEIQIDAFAPAPPTSVARGINVEGPGVTDPTGTAESSMSSQEHPMNEEEIVVTPPLVRDPAGNNVSDTAMIERLCDSYTRNLDHFRMAIATRPKDTVASTHQVRHEEVRNEHRRSHTSPDNDENRKFDKTPSSADQLSRKARGDDRDEAALAHPFTAESAPEREENDASLITLIIVNPAQQRFTVKLRPDSTIATLKQKGSLLHHVPVDSQRLVFRGKILQDDIMVKEVGILDDDTLLQLFPKPRVIDSGVTDMTQSSTAKPVPKREEDGASLINLIIVNPAQQRFKLKLRPNSTIATLKQKGYLLHHVPVDSQRLVFRGKILQDEKTLNEVGILDDDTLLQLFPNPRVIDRGETNMSRYSTVKPVPKLEEEEEASLITVVIVNPTQQRFTVKLSLSSTIAALKQKGSLLHHVPVDLQRLFFRGKILEDDKTLEEMGILEDTLLQLFPKPRAAGSTPNAALDQEDSNIAPSPETAPSHKPLHSGRKENEVSFPGTFSGIGGVDRGRRAITSSGPYARRGEDPDDNDSCQPPGYTRGGEDLDRDGSSQPPLFARRGGDLDGHGGSWPPRNIHCGEELDDAVPRLCVKGSQSGFNPRREPPGDGQQFVRDDISDQLSGHCSAAGSLVRQMDNSPVPPLPPANNDEEGQVPGHYSSSEFMIPSQLRQTNRSSVPTAPPAEKEDDEEPWPCPVCTFLNYGALNQCEMCETMRK